MHTRTPGKGLAWHHGDRNGHEGNKNNSHVELCSDPENKVLRAKVNYYNMTASGAARGFGSTKGLQKIFPPVSGYRAMPFFSSSTMNTSTSPASR